MTGSLASVGNESNSFKVVEYLCNNWISALNSVLKDTVLDDSEQQYVPVVISETDSMVSENSAIKSFYSSPKAKYANNPRYLNQIKEQSESFEWNDVPEGDYESIRGYFQTFISEEVSDERVAKEMLSLFGESKWAGIGGSR